MMSTGITDQHDTELFAGDVCWDADNEYHGTVTFDEGGYRYEWDNISESLYDASVVLELAGNIYQNSGLVETAA